MKASLKQNFIMKENINDTLFYDSLIEELNNLIEEELSKSYEEVNAEMIDDCCLALDSIYTIKNGSSIEYKDITSIENVVKKYNLQTRKKYIVSAACAAAAVFLISVSGVHQNSEILAEGNIFKSALGKFEALIKNAEITTPQVTDTATTETSDEITTQQFSETTQKEVSDERVIKNIYTLVPPGTNVVYNSVDEINLKGTFVGVDFTNGENEIINISACNVTIGEPQSDGETKITVSYKGAEAYIYVTVLPEEKLNPKTLTSIYGTFSNSYSLDDMNVFAVFSDGSEEEILKSDCKITTEEFVSGDVTEILVTVEYKNCSFQFISDEKEVE